MNENTIIKYILVIPYSKTTCVYYINEGDRHATTYEKIISMLTEIVPNLAIHVHEKLSRKISFFINLEENKLYDIESDNILINIKNIQSELLKIKRQEITKPKYFEQLEKLVSKVLTRSTDANDRQNIL